MGGHSTGAKQGYTSWKDFPASASLGEPEAVRTLLAGNKTKKIMKNIKLTVLALAAGAALVGCDQRKEAVEDQKDATKSAINNRKDAVEDAAKDAKRQSELNAAREKKQIEASKDAAQAQLDADKKKAEAQAEADKARIEAEKK